MAPGPSIEPRQSLAAAYSSQDHDVGPPCAHIEEQPPGYTRYGEPCNPILRPSDSIITGTEKSRRKRPNRHVNFIHDSPESLTPPNDESSTAHQPSRLKRGLQIPSRWSTVSSGFKLPPLLESKGVSQGKWSQFIGELRGFAKLSGKQWATYIGMSIGYGLLWSTVAGLLGTIPSTIMSHKLATKLERENITTAQISGLLNTFAKHWNENYFESLGLHVMIAIPGDGGMEDMDVASTKLFRYQQNLGVPAPSPGVASSMRDPKEIRYQRKEGHERVKATQKVRIIVVPYEKPATQRNGVRILGQTSIGDYFSGGGGGGGGGAGGQGGNAVTVPGAITL